MPPKWQQPREGAAGRGRGQRHNEQGQQQQLQPMYAPQGQGMPYQQHPQQQPYMNQQGYYENPSMQHQYPPYNTAYGSGYDMNAPYGHNQNFASYHNGGNMYPPMGNHPYNQYGQPQLPFQQQPQYIYNPAIPPQQFYPPQHSPRMATPSQQQYSQQPPPVVQTPPTGQLPFVPPANDAMGYNIGPRDEHVGPALGSAPSVVSGVTSSTEYIKSPPVAASSAALPLSSPTPDAVNASHDSAPRTISISAIHESPTPPTRSLNTTPLATPSAPVNTIVDNFSPATALAVIEFTPAVTPPLLPVTPTPSSPIFIPLAGHRLPGFTPPVPWTVESNASQPWPPRALRGKRRMRLVTPKSTEQITGPEAGTQTSHPVTPSTNESEVASTSPSVSSSLRLSATSDDKKRLANSSDKASSGNKSTKTSAQTTPVTPALPKTSPKSWTTVPRKSDGVKVTAPIVKTSQESQKPSVTNSYSALPTSADSEYENDKSVDSAASVKSGDEMVDSAVDLTKTSSEAGKEENKPVMPSRSIWTVDNVKSRIVGTANIPSKNGTSPVTGTGATNTTANSLAEALRKFNPMLKDSKVTFIKPRGLFNAGNMCYMNSVLQVLVFCPPFYNLLSIYGGNAVHSFKSENPLLEAMYMFIQEFSVIDAAKTAGQLKLRLKKAELDQFGKDLNPVSIYDAMKRIPRFVDMQQGQQQDAQEFLGFLLETLNDECVRAMQAPVPNGGNSTPVDGLASPMGSEFDFDKSTVSANHNDEWQQVGPKQKAALTRSSGTSISSPLTKIFGGNQRSELRVQSQKDSVTMQPYTSLQLDIGEDHVHNIVDALKALTRPEPLRGAFNLQKPDETVLATKQVFIETLPPILILHLKRFQYDDRNGPQKIWKHVGYPLELEIPKEVFPRQLRKQYEHTGTPKYRLTAVVYHHGPNASGGHYTVDVRRQDGIEWIRLDDTNITRIRDEDVAENGSGEESPGRVNGKAGDSMENQHKSIVEELEEAEAYGWKQASGPGKKWSAIANGNGTTTPKRKTDKFSVNDKKVAYLLFYQRTT